MYDTAEAVQFIRSHDSFVILGHKEPDGDCVASQLACAALLRALGKEATPPFGRSLRPARRSPLSKPTSHGQCRADRRGAAVMILDCSTPDRTGPLGRAW